MTEPARRSFAFADAVVGIPVLAGIPADEDIRRKSANYQIVGVPGRSLGGPLSRSPRARDVAEAPPVLPTPLDQDQLLGLFDEDEVGRNIKLEPATMEDLCGAASQSKPSLEVIYDRA